MPWKDRDTGSPAMRGCGCGGRARFAAAGPNRWVENGTFFQEVPMEEVAITQKPTFTVGGREAQIFACISKPRLVALTELVEHPIMLCGYCDPQAPSPGEG